MKDVAGPLGPIDPNDVVLGVWTEGYRLLETTEVEEAGRTLEQHRELVVLWYRLLTLSMRAFGTLADPPGQPAPLPPLARDVRLRLLALAGGTSKLALDAALAGYYSQSFALTRHLLESWFQIVHMRAEPHEADRWYERRGVPAAAQRFELRYGSVLRAIRNQAQGGDRTVIDQADRVYREMHAGAHPSSILLGQTAGEDEGTYVVGACFRPDFAVRALDRGVYSTQLLLGEMAQTEAMTDNWWTEYWAIHRSHRASLQTQQDAGDPAEDEPLEGIL